MGLDGLKLAIHYICTSQLCVQEQRWLRREGAHVQTRSSLLSLIACVVPFV